MKKNTLDYRNSHIASDKGESYHKTFTEMNYRKYIWSLEKKILNEILKNFFQNKKQIRYLDFACGTGRIIHFLEENMFESIGVDVSQSMIDIALKNVKKSKILKVDITQKRIFENNYFDFITAFRFFLNANSDLRTESLEMISKLLNKDGFFVFNIHLNKTSIFYKIARLIYKIKNLDSEIVALSVNEVKEMVEKRGLHIVIVYYYGLIPILNENTKIPIWLIDPIEKVFSRIPYFRNLSSHLIFVCTAKK